MLELDYDPSTLSFGTSGLRGLLSDMTDLECYINTAGFLRFMKDAGHTVGTVAIAGDLRHSTPHIMAVVAQAVADAGLKAINCGFIPTPALAYYAGLNQQACIMVTGSHIPDDRNGIKFYTDQGEVLKADEAGIKAAVAAVRAEIMADGADRFNADGSLQQINDLPALETAAKEAYISRYVDYFPAGCLGGTQVVVYQHSAVGRDLTVDVLEKLGAEVSPAGRSDKFIPIDTENVRPTDEVLFKEFAADHPDCFAILSTDGDGDRPFVIDETGTFHRGDVLGMVVAEYLESGGCAFPISTNDAVTQYLDEQGIHYRYTRIGSPHVITAMQDMADDYKNVCGWEVNGGFLVGEDYETDGRELKALPTRDALLPMIAALLDAKAKGLKLSELFAQLPARYTGAGLIDNFPNETSAKILEVLGADDERAYDIISQTFTAEHGFNGAVSDINSLDGVRITFDDGQVAHIRPSGNAPQLRIYSNAGSPERAEEIVSAAIAEPHGIYRQIEQLINEG